MSELGDRAFSMEETKREYPLVNFCLCSLASQMAAFGLLLAVCAQYASDSVLLQQSQSVLLVQCRLAPANAVLEASVQGM